MKIYINDRKYLTNSKVKVEEFIPLNITFKRDDETKKCLILLKKKKSYLEIVLGSESGLIHAIKLLLSDEVFFSQESIVVDSCEEKEVHFQIDGNIERINVSKFSTVIFFDGIKIILSNSKKKRCIKTGRIYFGIGEDNTITEIIIYRMSINEIEHTVNELKLQ